MIKYKTGDLFDDDAQYFVNAVNCVGIMGKGIALQFKRRYPEYFKHYQWQCGVGDVLVNAGDIAISDFLFLRCDNEALFLSRKYPECIISVATKTHWRDTSTLDDIRTGIRNMKAMIIGMEITSLAMPALGCGLGGLSWNDVHLLIEQELSDVDCDIRVYLPQ